MEHQLDLENKKYEQWVKAGLGLEYLGEGLTPFCDEVVTQQHNDILDTIKQTKNLSTVTCDQCILNKLKPDHVQTGNKQCPLGQANCNCLHPSGKQPCPNDVCGAIYDHIVTNYGSTPPAPYWRNTEAKWWCTDPWSVAKCFINSPVHYDIIDCTGVLRLIINNQGFHNHIDGTDVFSKVLQYRNEIYHSSSMELEENTANTYIDAMIAILQDGKELKTRKYAQNAVQKLLMLKKDDFIITPRNEHDVVLAAMLSIADTIEEFESNLRENLENVSTTEDVENKLPEKLEKIHSIEDAENKLRENLENVPTSVVTIWPPVLTLQEMEELKTAQACQRAQYKYIRSKQTFELKTLSYHLKAIPLRTNFMVPPRPVIRERHLRYSKGEKEWMSFLYSGNKKDAKRLVKLGHLPKQRILDEICLLFGRKSKVTLMICKAICAHIKSKDEHIIDVWAAYTLQNRNSISFVVSLEELEKTGKEDQAESIRLDKMIDYSFIKRIVGEYCYESTEIINHTVTSGEDFDDDAYCKLQTCVAKYSVELMKQHKYLSVVSACSKRSTGYGSSSWNLKPENCIVLYVHTKHYIPINEDPFKTHYDKIPVDVREGAFIPFGKTATDILDHVQMGCQIRGEVENGQYVDGTLGCFIDHPKYGVCGLTCAHVLLNQWNLTSLKSVHNGAFNWPLHEMCKTVYQPANQTKDIGHTVQLIYKEGSERCSGMDVALFKLTNRHPKSSDFPDASIAVSTTTRQINYKHWRICSAERLNSRMKHVVKFGSKTELRDGIIEFDIVSVKELDSYPLAAGYLNIKLHKQIEVKRHTPGLDFADKGDSGALVFVVDENSSEHTCIGIVEGGTSYGTVIVTPIVPVLDELKVSSLKSFETENTISEIHGKLENVGSEMQTVKNDVQTLTGEMQRMRSDIQTEMQNIDSRMDNHMQQIQQMFCTLQNPAPPNT